jgi:hypothetical protein
MLRCVASLPARELTGWRYPLGDSSLTADCDWCDSGFAVCRTPESYPSQIVPSLSQLSYVTHSRLRAGVAPLMELRKNSVPTITQYHISHASAGWYLTIPL